MCWAVREWDISALPTAAAAGCMPCRRTGLSAAVAQTVSRAAALEHWAEVRRIRDTARLACGVLGLFLSLCMFLLAEPFAALVAAQPYALFSLLAIAPAALFGCLTAVERGYWEGLQNMTPTAVSQALEAVAKLGLGLALCQWVLAASGNRLPPCAADVPLSALAAAGAVLGVTLSTAVGWLYFLLRGLRSGNRLPRGNAPAAPMGQIFRRLLYVMIPVALGSLVTNLTSLLDLVTMMRCLGRAQMLHAGNCSGGSGQLHLHRISGVCLRFVYRHGDHGVQPGAVCDQYAGEERTALCGGALGKTGSGRGCGAYSFGNRCSGGNGAPGGRRLVGAGRTGDAHSLRRQTRRGCHRPPEALRTLLPGMVCLCLTFPLCSILQGCRESRRSGGMYAGRGRRETPGQPSADSTPGVSHHRRRDRHIIVLPVLLGLILWQLRRCLEKPLHLMRTLLPIVLAAGYCTAAAWFCRESDGCAGMLPSAAAAAAGGCLVYLAVLYLLVLRRRKQTVSIPLNKGKQTAESAPER